MPGFGMPIVASYIPEDVRLNAEAKFKETVERFIADHCDRSVPYSIRTGKNWEEIVKEADVDFYAEVGDVINYTITATNSGQTALSNVDISDSLMADLENWQCTPALVVDDNPSNREIIRTMLESCADHMGLISEHLYWQDKDDVVEHVALSRRALEIRFEHSLGRSIRTEIQRVRLTWTKQLLVETNLPVAKVAEAAGFNSLSYLSKVFHREVGETLAQYRRQRRVL